MVAQRVRNEKSTPAVILMQRDTAVSIFEAERRQKQKPQSNTHQTLVAAQKDQHRGAGRNWRGIGIQLTQYTADAIDVLAREFGAESKGSGQNRESGATEQGQERTFLQHTPENHISDVDPQRYRNSAPSTKDGGKEHGAPAQTTASWSMLYRRCGRACNPWNHSVRVDPIYVEKDPPSETTRHRATDLFVRASKDDSKDKNQKPTRAPVLEPANRSATQLARHHDFGRQEPMRNPYGAHCESETPSVGIRQAQTHQTRGIWMNWASAEQQRDGGGRRKQARTGSTSPKAEKHWKPLSSCLKDSQGSQTLGGPLKGPIATFLNSQGLARCSRPRWV
ncbi:hypothetical protein DFH08DRAFT_825300 [Mycena albidolilacea]|uniref:Uncharacterized protein n=1 Tax=Mycena albidolilacea TaxID=1033008 RepID=A0AAD6Z298_9AGAR|nr:hypothetical protein DFH08DRAFT_825300 [Mycena albidolilacea]